MNKTVDAHIYGEVDANLYDEVDKAFKCLTLKNIVLDMGEMDRDELKTYVVDHAYRLITLSFYMFYSIYVMEIDKHQKTNLLNDRVRKHFSKLFSSGKVTMDLVFFVLMELQLESKRSRNKELSFLINNSFNLTYWKDIFKHQIINDREKKDMNEMLINFESTLQAFPYTKITTIGEEVSLVFEIKKGNNFTQVVSSNGLIELDQEYRRYKVLDSFECIEKEYYSVYKYLTITPEYTLPKLSEKIDCIHKILNLTFGLSNYNKNDGLLISKLYGSNFDRIRYLALSISDIVAENDVLEDDIIERYKELDVFKSGVQETNDANLSLDNVVTVLIIEEGPSKMLDFVLDDIEINYKRILEDIAMRMDSMDLYAVAISNYVAERKKLVKRYSNDKFTSSKKRVQWVKKHTKELMIQSIIMFVAHEDEKYHHLVESLNMREMHYLELYKSNKNVDLKIKEANYIFERTFAFLNIFYTGLIGYSLAEVEYETKFESIGEQSTMKIPEKQDYCELAFVNSANKWVDDYNDKGQSLGSLMSHFQKIMLSTFSVESNKVNVLQTGQALEKVIGRYRIGDCELFNKLVSGGSDATLQLIVNDFKHFYTKVVTKQDMRNGFERGFKLFEFLMYNKIDEDKRRMKSEVSYTSIYPLVVDFSMKKKIKDGYSVNSYTVRGMENSTFDIKILSAKEHKENEYYYCIPNMMSSSEYWWIDPFFIKCSKVDGILNKLKGNEFGEGEIE